MAALIEKPAGSGLSGCEGGGPVRRWEYVEGTASKFWETGADGGVVTVRYGRVGSDGRTQSKEFASADAAQEQLRRTIAEKERKGYREVGGAASAVSLLPSVRLLLT
ncbi:WGR domain-containing protein, partial [Streptomyces sp. NPDC002346]